MILCSENARIIDIFGEHNMAQADIQANLTSHTLAVEHIRISSSRSFAEVRQKLEATLPKLDASIAGALSSGDQKRAKDYDDTGPKLSIFEKRSLASMAMSV